MKVLAGSRNPVKIVATQEAFGRYFGPVDVIGIEVDSGVSVQPVNGETFAGARNRALALRQLNREQGLSAHFFVGIEGGMIQLHGTWFALGAMCVIDESGREGRGTSGLFELPPGLVPELLSGIELGILIDRLVGEHNTKQRGGAVSHLTRNVVDRKSLYLQGLLLALIPFLNEQIYPTN